MIQSAIAVVVLFCFIVTGCGGDTKDGGNSTSSKKSSTTSSNQVSSSSGVSSSERSLNSISSIANLSSSSVFSNSSVISSSNSSSISSSILSSSLSSSTTTSSASSLQTEVLAFPGAEGFAARVTGGRGGRVIKVTTLNPTGSGSLSEALAASGKRIVVFDVSGVIKVGSQGGGILYIENGDVTIAGQTAPGAGITIQGRLYAPDVENIIMRHLRIRPKYDGSDAGQFDAIQTYYGNKIIMDHISASFGIDETIDIYTSHDITVQWSTIESADEYSEHPDCYKNNVNVCIANGTYHNYGLINGSEGYNVSVNNNLFAHNYRRNPAISNGPAEVINNLIYNVKHAFHHDDPTQGGNFNVAGNYYKRGPNSGELHPFWIYPDGDEVDRNYFVNDWVDRGGGSSSCNEGAFNNPITQCDNNTSGEFPLAKVVNTKFTFSNIVGWKEPVITTPQESYANVLAKAGAFPRDVITKRSVSETQNRTGAWDTRDENLNLMEGLTSGSPPTDSDGDGMPDSWETARGLNPNVKDNNKIMPSGYDAIEEYINELADELVN